MLTEDEWDPGFERILRGHLPDFPASAPLRTDQALPALGLDSVGMVRLIMELEQAYGVTVPEEDLVPRNFATPARVWSVFAALRGQDSERV